MKLNYILLIIGLLIGKSTVENERYNFINDCIKLYGELNKVNNAFYLKIENNTEKEVLKTIVNEYNDKINSLSVNYLLKHSESEIESIEEITVNLRSTLDDFVKINTDYLNLLSDSDINQKKLIRKNKSLVKKNMQLSSILSGVGDKICGISVKNYKKMHSKLTLKQRNLLNEQLINEFGESVNKGSEFERETSFEYIAAFIYMYINLEKWEFIKE